MAKALAQLFEIISRPTQHRVFYRDPDRLITIASCWPYWFWARFAPSTAVLFRSGVQPTPCSAAYRKAGIGDICAGEDYYVLSPKPCSGGLDPFLPARRCRLVNCERRLWAGIFGTPSCTGAPEKNQSSLLFRLLVAHTHLLFTCLRGDTIVNGITRSWVRDVSALRKKRKVRTRFIGNSSESPPSEGHLHRHAGMEQCHF